MKLSEEIEKYQRTLKGLDEFGLPINLNDHRLKIIDQNLNNEVILKSEIDLVAVVKCVLKNVQFEECTLEDSLFFENSFFDITFSKCSLVDTQFRDNKTKNAQFINCNLGKIQLSNNVFKDTKFIDCDLSWSSLRDLVFENCDLHNLDLTGVTLNNVQFKNCEIKNCKSVEDYKISLIDYPKGKIGESSNLLNLIL